jgi:hypothetical protein
MRARWLDRLTRVVDGAGALLYERRHPGRLGRAVIDALAPLVRRATPNDKWNLNVFVPEWLSALEAAGRPPMPPPKRIFLFCAYRIEFTLTLCLATLLAWRGHRMTLGYLPKLQSPIKEPRHDHPSARPYLAAALGKVARLSAGRIRCVELTERAGGGARVDEAFVARQVRADLMIALKREALDPDDPTVRAESAHYEELGRHAQRIAWSHFLDHRDDYDLCLVPNGTTFETAHVCHVAKQMGLPVNTFEKFAFRNVRVVDHGDHCMAFDDLDLFWELRQRAGYEDEPYLSRACARAMELLDEHRSGATRHWALRLQTVGRQSPREVCAGLGLSPDEAFVLVCPNVPFDAGYMELTTIFPSMRQWMLDTVRGLLETTSLTVVVRAHPAEALHWGTRERTPDLLAQAGLSGPRLVVLPGDAPVNTYALVEACRFGVVFSSTIGLEMAMLGKTVLVGSDIYYTGRGFTVDAKSRDDYFAALGRLAAESPGLDDEQVRRAQLFSYLFHFVWQRPYPYDKPSGVRQLPPSALIARGEISRFVETLDALAADPAEWRANVPRWFRADRDEPLQEAPR